MGMTETLRLVIDGVPSGAKRALGEVRSEATKTEKTLSGINAGLNKAANIAAVGVAAGVGVMAKSLKTYEDYSSQVRSIQRALGADAEGASRLAGQWKRYGVDAGAATMATKTLAKAIDEARRGNAAYTETFNRLGLSIDQLKSMSDTEAIFAVRDALGELEAGAERTAIATKLLGRGAMSMSAWYSQSASDMARTNELLEKAGLVWTEEQVKKSGEAAKKMAELQVAILGLQIQIAQSGVVDSMIHLVDGLTALLSRLGPLARALPYVTAGLAAFVGVVKVISFVQFVRGLFSATSGVQALGAGTRGALPALTRLSTLLRGLPGLLSSTGGMYALVAAGIAADTYLIIKAIDAWRQMADAVRQARQAYADYLALTSQAEYQPGGKYYEGFKTLPGAQTMEQINAAAKANQFGYSWWYKMASGAYSSLLGPYGALFSKLGSGILPGFASGGTVKARRGGRLVLAGEGGEDEDFVPASQRVAYASRILGSGARTVQNFTINIASLQGTDERAARQLCEMVERRLSRRLRFAHA
ncbi:MAG TPA: hypothetical protein PKN52_00870 [Trueperaceae bacterium]|nr:hypothetical protein [Trueperaceae bacterium]